MSAPILLVEDEPLVREATRLLLEASGYDVREAGTAAAALESVSNARPALVLLDLGLPDASGLEFAHALAADPATRDIPVIAVTGRAGAQEKRDSLEAGCRACLVKPVPPKELLSRVSALLEPQRSDAVQNEVGHEGVEPG